MKCATPIMLHLAAWCMAMAAGKYLGLWGQISGYLFFAMAVWNKGQKTIMSLSLQETLPALQHRWRTCPAPRTPVSVPPCLSRHFRLCQTWRRLFSWLLYWNEKYQSFMTSWQLKFPQKECLLSSTGKGISMIWRGLCTKGMIGIKRSRCGILSWHPS